jgi:hypothetical protein
MAWTAYEQFTLDLTKYMEKAPTELRVDEVGSAFATVLATLAVADGVDLDTLLSLIRLRYEEARHAHSDISVKA